MRSPTFDALRWLPFVCDGKVLSDARLRDLFDHAQRLDRVVAQLRGAVSQLQKLLLDGDGRRLSEEAAIDALVSLARDTDHVGFEKRLIAAVDERLGRDVLARVRPAARRMGAVRAPLERDSLRKRVSRSKRRR